MSTPLERLTARLKNITQLTIQVEQAITSSAIVQATHPKRLDDIEHWLKLAHDEIKLVKEEDETAVGYWQEIGEALPIIIDRLVNAMTIQQNLDFIQATDKENLKRFLGYILLYGLPLFIEVVDEMDAQERDKMAAVFKRKEEK